MAKKGIFNEPLQPNPPVPRNSSRGDNPWGNNFRDYPRDKEYSGAIGMGVNYGTGYKAPVGSFKAQGKSAIPQGVKTYDPDTVI